MVAPTYTQNKPRIYKWRAANPEKWKEIANRGYKKHYEKNSANITKRCLARYYAQRELESFRRILL